jgi:hypothetical protein
VVRRACTEKLVGGRAFTTEDAADPILAALADNDPCERSGPFAATYWADLGRNIWRRVSAERASLFQHVQGGLQPTRPP